MTFEVGDKVTWISSNTQKVGEVIAVVPAGKTPAEIGHPKAGGGGIQRDHETYVIRGQQIWKGQVQPRKALYWPYVSLISKA